MLSLEHLFLRGLCRARLEPTLALLRLPLFLREPLVHRGLWTCLRQAVCRLLVPLLTTCGFLVEFCMATLKAKHTRVPLRGPMLSLTTLLTTCCSMRQDLGISVVTGILTPNNCLPRASWPNMAGKKSRTSNSSAMVSNLR